MSSLPNEIWMSIFEELDQPSDLAAVVRSNMRFRSLGERILYRHILWTDPRKFVQNYPFLNSNPALRTVVRTLTLGISLASAQLDRIEQINRARAVINLNGELTLISRPTQAHEARLLEEYSLTGQIDILASEQVTMTMYTHTTAFTNLRELKFMGMVLPDTFYAFVHNFPFLDKLSIKNCTPPLRPERTSLHPRDLPITELTILGLRGRRDPRELRSFGEGQQLRVIRFDWTCYIYKHFCETSTPNVWVGGFVVVNLGAIHPPPAHGTFGHSHQQVVPLSDNPTPSPFIHTIDVKFPSQKSWQSYVSEPHDQLINPFAEFLDKCPRVTTLKIRNHIPWLRVPDAALPNLMSYRGPLTTIVMKSIISGSRPIKHLDIRDSAGALAPLAKAFREIEASRGHTILESLSLFIGCWDDEILYAVLHHFRGLKELEIMYKEGDPTEEMILSMGAHFFGRMPNLGCARVFKVMPPNMDNAGSIAESLSARGYPQHAILGELIGVDSPGERTDFDDSELEEAKYISSPSHSSSAQLGQDSEEMELRELVNAWNRYCPSLREVQLRAGYVWRRAGEGDAWTRRMRKVTGSRSGSEKM